MGAGARLVSCVLEGEHAQKLETERTSGEGEAEGDTKKKRRLRHVD